MICCSRSSCLISTCCSTNQFNKFGFKCEQQIDRLIEEDEDANETECFENSNLYDYETNDNLDVQRDDCFNEENSNSQSDLEPISKTETSLNEVKSEDQSTYNQNNRNSNQLTSSSSSDDKIQSESDYTNDLLNQIDELPNQKLINDLKLTSLNALIKRTNQTNLRSKTKKRCKHYKKLI